MPGPEWCVADAAASAAAARLGTAYTHVNLHGKYSQYVRTRGVESKHEAEGNRRRRRRRWLRLVQAAKLVVRERTDENLVCFAAPSPSRRVGMEFERLCAYF